MITETDVPKGASRRWPIAYGVLFFSLWPAAAFGLDLLFYIGGRPSSLFDDTFQPVFFVPVFMLLLTAATSVITWSLLTRRRAGIKRWMIVGGVLSVLAFPAFLLIAAFIPVIPMFPIAVFCTLLAVGAGLVLGSVVCAVPMMVPSTLLRYGAYSRLMVVVSAAFCLAPLPLLVQITNSSWNIWILILYPLVTVDIVQVVLLVCSRCLLTDIRPGAEESCPVAAGIAAIRLSRPLPPVICLFFAALSGAMAVVLPNYLNSLDGPSCPAAVVNGTDSLLIVPKILTPMIICLPTFTIPLIIHHFREWHRLCKVLEPILCAASGVGLYFTIFAVGRCHMTNYGTFFPSLIAFSLCRTFLIGIAYSDLLWQVFLAHNDGPPTPVGTGAISITVSALGAVTGVLSVFIWATGDPSLDNVISMAVWYSIGASGLNLVANVWRAASDQCQQRRYERDIGMYGRMGE